jgi:plasmid stabilization system protein ParE
MKRYGVVIEEPAQADVQRSYDWGCRVWGKARARKWAHNLHASITKQLTTIPTGFPLAPENDEFREKIRQMIVGRYRVLFTIQGRRVHVLHVRGPYTSSAEATVGEE